MKILIAHWRSDIVSGAEFAIADMVKKGNSSIEYCMLTPGEGQLADFYRKSGFTVISHRVETRRRLFPGLHTAQSIFFAQRMKKIGVDAVVCNTFPAANRVARACLIANIPVAVYVREYIRDALSHRAILAKVDLTLAVSEDVAGYLSLMSPDSPIQVAWDHLNTEDLMRRVAVHKRGGARLLPFGAEHPVVGIVGRVTSYKQQDLFLRAIPFVLKDVPEARFVVVGSAVKRERDYEQGLGQLAADLKILDSVRFMGHRLDAIEIMSELEVCCLASDREPFPRTVLEAQAIGCPVVASDTGGCPEMIENEGSGLLFQVTADNAPKSLATQIVRILRDSELARSLSEGGQKSVRDGVGTVAPVRKFEEYLFHLAKKDQSFRK